MVKQKNQPYVLVENNDGFLVTRQGPCEIDVARSARIEEAHSGWAASIKYPGHCNKFMDFHLEASTREEALDKAYALIKEQFKKDWLVDKTSRVRESKLIKQTSHKYFDSNSLDRISTLKDPLDRISEEYQ